MNTLEIAPEAEAILSNLKVVELRAIAKAVHNAANDVKISGYSKMPKAELIRQLSFADAWYFAEMRINRMNEVIEEREMNEIRAEIAVEQSNVEAVTADRIVPAGMFDPELTYYADGTHVVMRAQGTEQRGVTIGMTTNAGPYQFQAVRFADGTVKNVAPHVLHRDDIAEQADADDEEIDFENLPDPDGSNTFPIPDGPWFDAQADTEAGELLDAALGEYVEPTASEGQIAITKYNANGAIATAVFGIDSIAGHITRQRGRWVLRDGVRTIRAKTLGKVAKLWAKALGFRATIVVETMS